MIFTVFYAELGVAAGIRYLCLYFSNLFFPQQVEQLITEAELPIAYNATILLTFITVVIIAPITEEFIFRGILLHRWSSKWGIAVGIVASSVLFGLVHGDIFIPERIFGGAIYAILYLKTKSLMVPIVLHAVNNLIAFLGTVVADFIPDQEQYDISGIYLWYAFIQLTLAVPALIYFLKIPSKVSQLPYIRNQQRSIDKGSEI